MVVPSKKKNEILTVVGIKQQKKIKKYLVRYRHQDHFTEQFCASVIWIASLTNICAICLWEMFFLRQMQYIFPSLPRDTACMIGAHSFNRFRGFDQKLSHYFFIIIKYQEWRRSNMFTPISLQICWLYWLFKMLRWIL